MSLAPGAAEIGADQLDRLRRDTLGIDDWLHFDNAGASPSPLPVHRRIVRHLEREREIGGYAAEREAEAELAGLYDGIAALIGAQRDEIAFAESATRAWDMAFYGIRLAPGDRILTGRAEYSSNYLAFLHVAQRDGVVIDIVPDGEDGTLDVAALAARLDERTKVVNVCHVPTSNALITDVEAVGAVLKDHPALYIVDACQSIGQREIDVRRIGCDVLSATGRKYLRGPRGTGFLYVNKSAFAHVPPAFVDIRAADWIAADRFALRADARRYESWESAIAARLGLKEAVDYALEIGMAAIEARIGWLAERLREALARCQGVRLLDRGTMRSGIVTFVVDGRDSIELRERLNRRKIALTAIERADARLDLECQPCAAILRASVHCFNTESEIARFVDELSAAVEAR